MLIITYTIILKKKYNLHSSFAVYSETKQKCEKIAFSKCNIAFFTVMPLIWIGSEKFVCKRLNDRFYLNYFIVALKFPPAYSE